MFRYDGPETRHGHHDLTRPLVNLFVDIDIRQILSESPHWHPTDLSAYQVMLD